MSYYSRLAFHDQLQQAGDLIAPLPETVTRLASVIAMPDTGINDVCRLIAEDPALTSAVLREANSAASSARDAIDTVQAAGIRLGGARILAIAVKSALTDTVAAQLRGYDLAAETFWRHGSAASVVAETVLLQSSATLGGGLVTAALLQDIGVLVLDPFMVPSSLAGAMAATGDQALAERELIEIDHGTAGAMLCRHWGLPESIARAIGQHHLLDSSPPVGAYAVYVSDWVTRTTLPGPWMTPSERSNGPEVACNALGLTPGRLLADAAERLRSRGFERASTDRSAW